jgi:glycosyltransferase involved in cell wall biosynthesis
VKIVFFTFYYPPDLCAGSFRAVALAKALSSKMAEGDELHIITTHPNRYANHRVEADNFELDGKIKVHRIMVPSHQSGMLSQERTFSVYALASYKLCVKISPDFLVGTTSRLMTGVLTGISAFRLRINYFIDLRDIFSETISDLFSRKSRMVGVVAKSFFSFLDRRLLKGAVGVNVVSEGFPEYFRSQGVDSSNWTFFPNGVDQEFIGINTDRKKVLSEVTTILYAGNIGGGQGLETIVPQLAKQLGDRFRLVIVGDGGTAHLLKDKIVKDKVNNVELVPPVSRIELMDYYQRADILFLHLNDVPAFRRVLPSKIFEYAALGKPIVAGLNGYSAQFLKGQVPYANIFNPGDCDGAYQAVIKASNVIVSNDHVDQFVEKYSRKSIMDKMADHLFGVMNR